MFNLNLITMKKLSLFLVCIFFVFGVSNAQGKHQGDADFIQVSKGDWSFGASGVIFNRSDVTLQTGLYAKYLVSDNIALRMNIRFGRDWAKGTDPEYIVDEDGGDYYANTNNKEDETMTTIRTSNVMLIFGAEKRHKVANRFVGYYGLDFGIGGYGQLYREKKDGDLVEMSKVNRSVDVALQPFIGVEYFLGYRVSLAAEFGYDVLFKFYAKDAYKAPSYGGSSSLNLKKYPQYNSIASHIDLGNCTFAALKLAYYF